MHIKRIFGRGRGKREREGEVSKAKNEARAKAKEGAAVASTSASGSQSPSADCSLRRSPSTPHNRRSHTFDNHPKPPLRPSTAPRPSTSESLDSSDTDTACQTSCQTSPAETQSHPSPGLPSNQGEPSTSDNIHSPHIALVLQQPTPPPPSSSSSNLPFPQGHVISTDAEDSQPVDGLVSQADSR